MHVIIYTNAAGKTHYRTANGTWSVYRADAEVMPTMFVPAILQKLPLLPDNARAQAIAA